VSEREGGEREISPLRLPRRLRRPVQFATMDPPRGGQRSTPLPSPRPHLRFSLPSLSSPAGSRVLVGGVPGADPRDWRVRRPPPPPTRGLRRLRAVVWEGFSCRAVCVEIPRGLGLGRGRCVCGGGGSGLLSRAVAGRSPRRRESGDLARSGGRAPRGVS
jgi:hypothetical protein